jgi:hypothetical protein
MAELWGGKYRDRIAVIRAVKSVTTPTFAHPVRVDQQAETGILCIHAAHPEGFPVPETP